MGSFGLRLTGSVVIAVAYLVAPALAQQKSAPPDFSISWGIGWASADGNGADFSPVPGTVAPVTNDPAHANTATLSYQSGLTTTTTTSASGESGEAIVPSATPAFGGITNANSSALYHQRQIQAGVRFFF